MSGRTLQRRGRYLALVSIVALLPALWLGSGIGAAKPSAEAAKRKSLTINDNVRLRLVRRNGNVLYHRGTATGTLPGRVSARFVTSLTKVTGTVTFRPYSGGSITMTAVGYPTSTRRVTGITGSIAVRRGTGRYRNALGSGTLSGKANRRTWAVNVNARANISY